jgi:aspartate-semialdehyde dehydrogenase
MAKRSFNVAVVGATGNVGRAMLQVLAELVSYTN